MSHTVKAQWKQSGSTTCRALHTARYYTTCRQRSVDISRHERSRVLQYNIVPLLERAPRIPTNLSHTVKSTLGIQKLHSVVGRVRILPGKHAMQQGMLLRQSTRTQGLVTNDSFPNRAINGSMFDLRIHPA
eukprot:jgi/Psemu1/309324/fgenesh1_kg.499_\